MSLEHKLSELLENYEPISDPQERLALFVDASKRRIQLPVEDRQDAAKVTGCVSAAWISGSLKAGVCDFRCAADSPIVLGLLSGLCDFYSGATPEDVAGTTSDPLAALGLSRNLSPTRLNGLSHARHRIKEIAKSLCQAPQS